MTNIDFKGWWAVRSADDETYTVDAVLGNTVGNEGRTRVVVRDATTGECDVTDPGILALFAPGDTALAAACAAQRTAEALAAPNPDSDLEGEAAA